MVTLDLDLSVNLEIGSSPNYLRPPSNKPHFPNFLSPPRLKVSDAFAFDLHTHFLSLHRTGAWLFCISPVSFSLLIKESEQGVGASTMALDNAISSPHRRTQGAFASSSPHKKFSHNDISFTSLIQRHRFLLVALVLLVVLCTVYLYFAVTMSSGESCSGLLGTERALCLENQGKGTFNKGKLKLF